MQMLLYLLYVGEVVIHVSMLLLLVLAAFFTLELTDSYGDGWNGGSMDVVVNGTTYYLDLQLQMVMS
jgi:hypothetical protein